MPPGQVPKPLDVPAGLPASTASHAAANDHPSHHDTARCHELILFASARILPTLLKYKTNPIPESCWKGLFPKATPGAGQGPHGKLKAPSN